MECERIQDLLSDSLDGSLPESGRAEVSAHLRECRSCAQTAEGLEHTIRLLRNLPPLKAPPELLERIRRETAMAAPAKPLWKKLFLPAHVKIPIEAAAAILLFLLVYGIQKGERPAVSPPPPSARMETPAPPAAKSAEPAEKGTANAPAPSRTARAYPPARPAPEPDSARRVATREGRDRSGLAPRAERRYGRPHDAVPGPLAAGSSASPEPRAQATMPVVPAQRVSTSAERIEPVLPQKDAAEREAPMRMLAAPPSRVLHPVPYGREVMLVVTAAELAGLEERIVEAARRRGGSQVREPAAGSAAAEGKTAIPEAVRIQMPAESAEPFLSDLRTIGTIPPEGTPGWADLPAGPAPGTVLYTVRIRVR